MRMAALLACFAFEAGEGSIKSLADAAGVWSFPIVPFVSLSLLTVLYLAGWRKVHRLRPRQMPGWRAGSFLLGAASVWIALASPIDALDDSLLTAHMLQHFILMSVAPPLLVLGAPAVPLLRVLPHWLIGALRRPLFAARWFHRAVRFVTHPAFAWLAMNVAYLGWHIPAMFDLTFESDRIHDFEHLCFLLTSILFWWVVLAPWPARRRWPAWTIIPYLLTADVLNTVLSATLAFSGKVLYWPYAQAPRVCGLSPLQDQIAAGAEMWVLNSLVFVVPAVAVTFRLLAPKNLALPLPGESTSMAASSRGGL